MNDQHGVSLGFDGAVSSGRIRRLADIPSIQTMGIPDVDFIVPGIISRGSLTMWAGVPGAAKSYLILRLAIAAATGGEFLGRVCKKCPVLILDYENPAHEVRKRLDLMAGERIIPDLHIWGIWNEQDPPRIGSELLMSIAAESPLMIFDPFRNAHGCDENDSTEMTSIMQHLTYLKKR
ncbi:MAG TPA: AAA family ATPase [Terriglobales bacterium]|nr:AAA family ATPase [Terriglobales bacterium]